MIAKFFEKILQDFPTIAVTIGIVVLVIYILREYRKMREENKESIQQAVDAKLGSILSGVQTEIAKLDDLSKKIENKISSVDSTYDTFSTMISETTTSITNLAKDAEKKLHKLNKEIPDIEDYSARDIIGLSDQQDDPKVKAALCSRILNHPDATSNDYEAAGNRMRRAYRYNLALQLYEKAINSDNESISANIEYLCLKSSISAKERDASLRKAKELSISNISNSNLSTVFNVLIHLDRWNELKDFSEQIIESLEGKRPETIALAKRNQGQALKELGDMENSLVKYQEALELSPDDENILKSYLLTLKDQGIQESLLALSEKLISLDPSDISYYILHIDILLELGFIEESEEWLEMALELNPSPLIQAQLAGIAKKLATKKMINSKLTKRSTRLAEARR